MSTRTAWTRGRRGRITGAVAALVVAGAAVAVIVTTTGGDEGATPARADAPTTSASPSSAAKTSSAEPATTEPTTAAPPAAAPPSGAVDPVTGRPPEQPPVALDAPASVAGEVTARLTSIEAIQGDAGVGVGEVDGPALRVGVELTNGTAAELSLAGVAVELYSGAELTPAPPLSDPSRQPFQGAVAAGGTATAVYVFRVPVDDRDVISVLVEHQPGAPFMVFRGPVS